MRSHSKLYVSPSPTFDDSDDKDKDKEIDLKDPKVVAAIAAAVADAIKPLEANRDQILVEKRDGDQKFKELLKTWEGLDAESVRALMARFQDSEEAQLIADGKWDEVIARKTEALRNDFQTKLDAALAQVTDRDTVISERDVTIKGHKIGSAIAAAAAPDVDKKRPGLAGAGALRDAISLAHSVFSVDEKGNLVARDESGTLLMGKDGTTPLQPGEWLDGQKTTSPHWWGPSSGGGASGGQGGDQGDPEAKALDSMSSRQKLSWGLERQEGST